MKHSSYLLPKRTYTKRLRIPEEPLPEALRLELAEQTRREFIASWYPRLDVSTPWNQHPEAMAEWESLETGPRVPSRSRPPAAVHVGDTFGDLLVMAEPRFNVWECTCECGGKTVARGAALLAKTLTNCGGCD